MQEYWALQMWELQFINLMITICPLFFFITSLIMYMKIEIQKSTQALPGHARACMQAPMHRTETHFHALLYIYIYIYNIIMHCKSYNIWV